MIAVEALLPPVPRSGEHLGARKRSDAHCTAPTTRATRIAPPHNPSDAQPHNPSDAHCTAPTRLLTRDAVSTTRQIAGWERGLFFGLPLGILLISYIAACVEAGTAWPWGALLHESGDKTLLQTLLYYDHAARELPVDLVLAVAAAAGLWAHGFGPRPVSPAVRWALFAGWVGSLVVIVLGTIGKVGFEGLGENLAQLHTRPGAPLKWGAHFRYHFLSRLGIVVIAWWVPGVLQWLTGEKLGNKRPKAFGSALGLFAAFTILYVPSLEPFVHPHFLGHQAREALTHALVTFPLCVGIALLLADRDPVSTRPGPKGRPPAAYIGAAALAAVLVAWTGLGAVLTGASEERQTDSVVGILFVHFFEHGLGYVFAPCFAGWLFSFGRTRAAER